MRISSTLSTLDEDSKESESDAAWTKNVTIDDWDDCHPSRI